MKLKNLTKYIALAFLAAAVIVGGWSIARTGSSVKKTAFALNTFSSVTVYGSQADQAASSAIESVQETEALLSAYLLDSEVARVNRVQKKDVPIPVSDSLFSILKTALQYWRQTGGLFDITIKPVSDLWSIAENPRVPSQQEIQDALTRVGYENVVLDEANKTVTFLKDGMQIDLGGIAKGYAADEAAKTLQNAQRSRALVDLGGNIVLLGQNNTPMDSFCNTWLHQAVNKPWRVGIQKPFAPTGSYFAVVSVQNEPNRCQSVVTSGAYERNFEQDGVLYHHILNPHTGYPYNGAIDSVTVLGPSSMDADALSTSIYMMDIADGMALARQHGYAVLILDKDKKIHTTLDKSRVEITDSAYSFAD